MKILLMYIDIALALKINGLNEAVGLSIARLLQVALLHAEENNVVPINRLLANRVEHTVGSVWLKTLTLGQLNSQLLCFLFVLGQRKQKVLQPQLA